MAFFGNCFHKCLIKATIPITQTEIAAIARTVSTIAETIWMYLAMVIIALDDEIKSEQSERVPASEYAPLIGQGATSLAHHKNASQRHPERNCDVLRNVLP